MRILILICSIIRKQVFIAIKHPLSVQRYRGRGVSGQRGRPSICKKYKAMYKRFDKFDFD